MLTALTRFVRLLVLGSSLLLACREHPSSPPAPEKSKPATFRPGSQPQASRASDFEPGSAERGKALLAELQCNRCHAGTGLPAPALDQGCVGCHEQIATDKFSASASKLAKWKPHVQPYRDVPSLADLGQRLRPAWIRDYLLHPHDLRPSLAQSMPRLAISAEQARDIATYLTAGAVLAAAPLAVRNDAREVAHGKQLLSERGCVTCHRFSGTDLPAPATTEAASRTLSLAPDLRFARERAEPSAIARWLTNPSQVKRDAVMPNLHLAPEDVRDLAAFLSFGELSPLPEPPPFERLPVLERRVGFDEVNERVFAVTCRHCHTNPDSAGGDGGPGNTGGFGFKPRKIDFSSYQGIQSGALDERGERVSLFAPTEAGLPRLVAALVARAGEVRGHETPGIRGMPLGLPPLSAEQIQLVQSWVAQGRPL